MAGCPTNRYIVVEPLFANNMHYAIASSGLFFCIVFLSTEAIRSVYFGGVFQQASSFLVGSLVFGVITAGILSYTYFTNPSQLRLAWSVKSTVVKVNILTAASWMMYFFAIQMIEPAVAYTIFSGVILITMLIAARSGLVDEKIEASTLVSLGYKGILLALFLLTMTTLVGLSGFVRGATLAAAAGVALAIGAGTLIAYAMIVCKQLDQQGLAPSTQLGVRFILYVLVGGGLAMYGLDYKGEISSLRLMEIVALGIVLTGAAGYAVQKAVSLMTSQSIGVASAFGPCLVFALQLVEGRVDFTPWTLIGVCLYCFGALLVSLGPVLSSQKWSIRAVVHPKAEKSTASIPS